MGGTEGSALYLQLDWHPAAGRSSLPPFPQGHQAHWTPPAIPCMEQFNVMAMAQDDPLSVIIGHALGQLRADGTFIVDNGENYRQWIQLETEREYS